MGTFSQCDCADFLKRCTTTREVLEVLTAYTYANMGWMLTEHVDAFVQTGHDVRALNGGSIGATPTQTDVGRDAWNCGWNTWNTYASNINSALILESAQALVDSGLSKLGYVYVNIDDTWQAGSRVSNGTLGYNTTKFPEGMSALTDKIHSLGLKAGIYSSAGLYTCAGLPAVAGFEMTDAADYARWGFDYLKPASDLATFCRGQFGTPNISYLRYEKMSKALNATGRPILYSLCSWGWDSVEDFGDMDMLESPLILGNDIRNMTNDTLAILSNRAILAINQDSGTSKANRIWSKDVRAAPDTSLPSWQIPPNVTGGSFQLWSGSLADDGGKHLVTLFNTSPQNLTWNISLSDAFPWVSYGDLSSQSFTAFDVWAPAAPASLPANATRAEVASYAYGVAMDGTICGSILEVAVEAHGVRLFVLTPSNATCDQEPAARRMMGRRAWAADLL
ncbi:hypothetical protein RQP46_006198 [Phenoliferia psychrophenolica]